MTTKQWSRLPRPRRRRSDAGLGAARPPSDDGRDGRKRNSPRPSSSGAVRAATLLLSVSLALLASVPRGCDARRLAALRRGAPPVRSSDDFPRLESALFLYRGGSDGDNDEIEASNDEATENVDSRVKNDDENIQVTSAVASSEGDAATAAAAATVETTTHSAPLKKHNAVGDPDGNSSDDESASDVDEDDLNELDELERELVMLELERQKKQRQQEKQGNGSIGEGVAGFETLVEMAERREGMKKRISEMEGELARRRSEEEGRMEVDGSDDAGAEEEGEGQEGEDLGEDDDLATSYNLAGTNLTKEEEVLRRQRKYKRGSIFKDSSKKDRKSSSDGNVNTATAGTKSFSTESAAKTPPVIPTTIDSATFDSMLVSAFRSMILLPPPSPRLPSPEGSVSLRNVDVASRRRLDRRTLYHGLLAELGGSHHHHGKDSKDDKGEKSKKDSSVDSAVRRRYLDADISRSLKGALSLACQPRWRERLGGTLPTGSTAAASAAAGVQGESGDGGDSSKPTKSGRRTEKEGGDEEEEDAGEEALPSWWYRGGVCLFPSDEELAMMQGGGGGGAPMPPLQQQQQSFMGQQGMGNMNSMESDGSPQGTPRGFFGPETNEDDAGEPTAQIEPWKCTMGMQETVAAALAHSLSCGLALVDDDALAGVRGVVEKSVAALAAEASSKSKDDGEDGDEEDGDEASSIIPTINPEELRNSALLGHLIRLADEGKLGGIGGKANESDRGTISKRMARDMELGLDDPNDELAVESLRLMKEDEQHWFEPIAKEDTAKGENDEEEEGDGLTKMEGSSASAADSPLSLVLFLRSDSSPSILRSKSAVELLARVCVERDGIHLLVLGGKGIDASTTSLPDGRGGFGGSVGAANGRMRQFDRQNVMGGQQQGQGQTPFAFMSNYPPGSPEFNAQMSRQQQGQQQQQQNPFQQGQQGGFQGFGGPGAHFSANNANASGVNDPEGSRRFNIFLARTVNPEGKPQIMGTIAPPAAGNLFPTILANMAKENLRKIHEQGLDEDNEQQVMFVRQMEELASQAEAHMAGSQDGSDGSSAAEGSATNAAFFNATITSPFGSEIFRSMNPENGDEGNPGEQFMNNPPPEHVRRAIQDAMSGVIDRLAQMSAAGGSGKQQGGSGTGPNIPMSIARAFSQVLSNENLRRGISENLSKAAPALIDPRCQGVMLSVYVPPGPEHPNRGMMPGDQPNARNQKGQSGQQQQPQGQPKQEKGSENVPHGMGGWLNKILSSDKSKHGNEEEEDAPVAAESDEGVDDASIDTAEADRKTTEAVEQIPSKSKRSGKKTKRERNLDRARTLAVAAAALAGAKKNRRESKSTGGPGGAGGRQQNVKLTPEQKAQRNLQRLRTLCRTVPLTLPVDPVRARSWDAWASREEGSVVFRRNRDVLRSLMEARGLDIDAKGGTRGAGIVLRQMMSAREIEEGEMEEVVRRAVETEAGKSQRHHESPWGVAKPTTAIIGKPSKLAMDKTLVNFLCNDVDGEIAQSSDAQTRGATQFIHPNSLESALSLICGVSPSPGSSSGGGAGTGVQASHRTKEDLLALATDKHERALVPNCVSPQDIGVTYDMIGGLGEVKELLRQSITYPLKFPHLYSEGIAREAVKGVLLFGPPGTGKTMLAKAVATEGGASFLSVDASSVENKWLGESEKNAKAVFTLARRLAPCVVFIDEVDSLLSSREGSSDDSAHGTLTSVKTTMMSEWDGLNSGTNGRGDAGSDRVVVIGSTNRPFDLDEAVLRRFPRRILVDLPDLETRREILEVTLAENHLGGDVNLTLIAERLEGYTGSDPKEVCREAVVQISHEQARMLDRGEQLLDSSDDEGYTETDEDDAAYGASSGSFQMLRPVTMADFESAMRKLKRSVSETGRELAKVWEWNDEYGEIKKASKREVLPQMMNMFLSLYRQKIFAHMRK